MGNQNKRKKFLLLTLVFLLFNLIVFGSFYFSIKDNKSVVKGFGLGSNIILSPTPFPFQEMTIPYLRLKVYESKLGGLEKISSNVSYASYLTSYSSDGFRVNGLLTIPNGDVPKQGFPAIVFIHGYISPTLYETLGQSYSSYVDYLAKS